MKTVDRFRRGCVLPFCCVQRATRRKNGLCQGSARGNRDFWEGQQPFRPNPNEVGSAHHVDVAVNWCRVKLLAQHVARDGFWAPTNGSAPVSDGVTSLQFVFMTGLK